MHWYMSAVMPCECFFIHHVLICMFVLFVCLFYLGGFCFCLSFYFLFCTTWSTIKYYPLFKPQDDKYRVGTNAMSHCRIVSSWNRIFVSDLCLKKHQLTLLGISNCRQTQASLSYTCIYILLFPELKQKNIFTHYSDWQCLSQEPIECPQFSKRWGWLWSSIFHGCGNYM